MTINTIQTGSEVTKYKSQHFHTGNEDFHNSEAIHQTQNEILDEALSMQPGSEIQTNLNLATSDNFRNFEPTESASSTACNSPLIFTVITGTKPDRLTKIIGLGVNDQMRKVSCAKLSHGNAQRVAAANLYELNSHLDNLTSAQAVAWGVTVDEAVALCTQSNSVAQNGGAVARTRANFTYRQGPGLMMLDHDGLADGELSADQLRNRLIAAVPSLANAPMLWRPSASAGCVHPDGRTLSGLTRHRLYIPVEDASLIPQAGKALENLLWATTGEGWIAISKAGQPLARCLFDVSVWQPERLDFAGPPILVHGVTRGGVAGVIYGDANARFDLRSLINSATPTIEKQAFAMLKAARAAAAPQCEAIRKAWVTDKAPGLAQRRGIKLAQATNLLERAASSQALMGDFELTCSNRSVVTVAQLLEDPNRWHNARFADPLDPDKDKRVAVAHLLNGTPRLFSHRHGGMRYDLFRQSARVQLGKGLRVASTDAVLQILRDRSELFDFGSNAIAYVANGNASPVTQDWLWDHIGRVAEYYSVKHSRDEEGNITSKREYPEDAPRTIASAIMAKHGSRHFRKLIAVTTAPTLRPDGSVLDLPGHDQATGLLYVTSDANPVSVPTAPNVEQALSALTTLWNPIRMFPFADPTSIGVTLAAMVAACLRPSLPTCPATGFDAPAAGTGKTLLAKCIGALATGEDVAVLSPATDEDECRKRLFAALRGGSKVLLWDNVRDPLGNAVIDSFLTSPMFADRVLGSSQNLELPNRCLFLISGNNLRLTGDTHRRVLLARLDAKTEAPFKREFLFDPLAEVCQNRHALVVAALTIVRAYITAGRPKAAKSRIASFEQWDDLVRQPLCWLRDQVAAVGPAFINLPVFGDPADSIERASSDNPEITQLAALLTAWRITFGNTPASPKQAINKAIELRETDPVLYDAIDEIAGLNVRTLGRWLESHKDQLCAGLRLVLANRNNGLKRWVVEGTVP